MPNDSNPAPETLSEQVKADSAAPSSETTPAGGAPKPATPARRRGTYRPSHKATFIGLAVVAAILLINAGVIAFVLKGKVDADTEASRNGVTLSPAVLDGLGVSRTAVGNDNTELIVGPNSRFKGKLTVARDVSIGGQLQLNSKFSASDASLAKLEAGDTSVQQLNVNGDATISTLNLRKDLTVAGTTRLQGQVTVSQLMTVNNNLNVAGSLAVGGTLSVRNFQAASLTSDSTLTIGGHIITRGQAPGVSEGGGLGSNGTASISGSDAAGTVAAGIGVGGGNGMLASVTFRNKYSNTPRVIVTAIGRAVPGLYVSRSASGFSIYADGALPPGGYAFDYIVMQ